MSKTQQLEVLPVTPVTLRQLRKAKRLTLRQLSAMSGIDQGTLSRYERGLCNPKWANSKKLADALNVDVVEVYNAFMFTAALSQHADL